MALQDREAGTSESARIADHERQRVKRRDLAALRGAAQVQKAEPQTIAGAPAANVRPRPSRGEAVSSPAHETKCARRSSRRNGNHRERATAEERTTTADTTRPPEEAEAGMSYNIAYARGVAEPAAASAPEPPAQSPRFGRASACATLAGISHIIGHGSAPCRRGRPTRERSSGTNHRRTAATAGSTSTTPATTWRAGFREDLKTGGQQEADRPWRFINPL